MTQVFISYAHDNTLLAEEFEKHFKPIARRLKLVVWRDTRRITGGQKFDDVIGGAIAESEVFLFLATPESVASDYIFERERPAIEARKGLLLPIILVRCQWEDMFEDIQAIPFDAKGKLVPVSEWRPRLHGYHAAALQSRKAIEHYGKRPSVVFDQVADVQYQ